MPLPKKERTRAEERPAQPEHRLGSINARIIDVERGLQILSGVSAVRIHSKGYNLLIMDDYMPTLGKIDGDIILLTRDGEVSFQGIRGFYKHQHNEFTLLIEEKGAASGLESEAGEP